MTSLKGQDLKVMKQKADFNITKYQILLLYRLQDFLFQYHRIFNWYPINIIIPIPWATGF